MSHGRVTLLVTPGLMVFTSESLAPAGDHMAGPAPPLTPATEMARGSAVAPRPGVPVKPRAAGPLEGRRARAEAAVGARCKLWVATSPARGLCRDPTLGRAGAGCGGGGASTPAT